MKKIILLAAVAVSAVACHKEPVTDRDGEHLVYTVYDNSADFGSYTTFTVADSILVVSSSAKPEYSKSALAKEIVAEFKDAMEARGYVYTADKDEADLGIQVSYITQTTYYTGYAGNPYWWLDYPGYWSPYSWGNWGGWGYAYPVTYSYTSNSMLAEMVDLTSEEGADAKLNVLWNCYIAGDLNLTSNAGRKRLYEAVKQGYDQSSYIVRQ